MSLRIRQIVVAADDLKGTVAQFQSVLGLQVCFEDPEVETFGLRNALMPIGDQFLEVVSPVRPDTAVGRHLKRHGDSAYMLILQTDDLARAEARLQEQSVRIVWRAAYRDISAVHLHPKDIGGALVSIDEARPPNSWRWAGPTWMQSPDVDPHQHVITVTLSARDPDAMSRRWAQVLGTTAPAESAAGRHIGIDGGALEFVRADVDVIAGFRISMASPQRALDAARSHRLSVEGDSVSLCGTRFELVRANHSVRH
jgi:hypothetical protein